MSEYRATIEMDDGNAEVYMGNRRLTVNGRGNSDRPGACPVELLVAALGS